MPLTLEIYGNEQLMARLASLPVSLDLACVEGTKKIAEDIRDTAKFLCPVDTGSLRASIRLQVYAKPAKHVHRIGVSAGGYVTNPKSGRKVDYAAYVEYGTSRTRAQPFMRPAMAEHSPKMCKIITERIKK